MRFSLGFRYGFVAFRSTVSGVGGVLRVCLRLKTLKP